MLSILLLLLVLIVALFIICYFYWEFIKHFFNDLSRYSTKPWLRSLGTYVIEFEESDFFNNIMFYLSILKNLDFFNSVFFFFEWWAPIILLICIYLVFYYIYIFIVFFIKYLLLFLNFIYKNILILRVIKNKIKKVFKFFKKYSNLYLKSLNMIVRLFIKVVVIETGIKHQNYPNFKLFLKKRITKFKQKHLIYLFKYGLLLVIFSYVIFIFNLLFELILEIYESFNIELFCAVEKYVHLRIMEIYEDTSWFSVFKNSSLGDILIALTYDKLCICDCYFCEKRVESPLNIFNFLEKLNIWLFDNFFFNLLYIIIYVPIKTILYIFFNSNPWLFIKSNMLFSFFQIFDFWIFNFDLFFFYDLNNFELFSKQMYKKIYYKNFLNYDFSEMSLLLLL